MRNFRQASRILLQNGVRNTHNRLTLLDFLIEKPMAYTLGELNLHIPIDRATIYRSLNMFADAGLVLKIVNRFGTTMYAFQHAHCSKHQMHPHMHCTECNKVICLPCLPESYLLKLNGYRIKTILSLLEGICTDCIQTH